MRRKDPLHPGQHAQRPDGDALVGCNSNPSASIPVLERVLTDNKVSLPPRPGMAAPMPAFDPKAYCNTAECLTAAYAAKAPLNLCSGKM